MPAGIVFQGVTVSNIDGFDVAYTRLVRPVRASSAHAASARRMRALRARTECLHGNRLREPQQRCTLALVLAPLLR